MIGFLNTIFIIIGLIGIVVGQDGCYQNRQLLREAISETCDRLDIAGIMDVRTDIRQKYKIFGIFFTVLTNRSLRCIFVGNSAKNTTKLENSSDRYGFLTI